MKVVLRLYTKYEAIEEEEELLQKLKGRGFEIEIDRDFSVIRER